MGLRGTELRGYGRAETLVHEFLASRPRHLTGLLHGAYAFTGVAGFWRETGSVTLHTGRRPPTPATRRLQARPGLCRPRRTGRRKPISVPSAEG